MLVANGLVPSILPGQKHGVALINNTCIFPDDSHGNDADNNLFSKLKSTGPQYRYL